MREVAKIDRILSKLSKVWKNSPDLRLGQLLQNYIWMENNKKDKMPLDIFYYEDSLTERRLDEMITVIDYKKNLSLCRL